MELTIEEKLDRLEAGLAEIGKRLDALEAAQREGLAQWKADRERWAADEAAGGVAREEDWEAWFERRVGHRPQGLRGSIRIVGRNGEVSYPRVVVAEQGWPANPAGVSEAAGNEQEDRQFSEALKRLDMKSL